MRNRGQFSIIFISILPIWCMFLETFWRRLKHLPILCIFLIMRKIFRPWLIKTFDTLHSSPHIVTLRRNLNWEQTGFLNTGPTRFDQSLTLTGGLKVCLHEARIWCCVVQHQLAVRHKFMPYGTNSLNMSCRTTKLGMILILSFYNCHLTGKWLLTVGQCRTTPNSIFVSIDLKSARPAEKTLFIWRSWRTSRFAATDERSEKKFGAKISWVDIVCRDFRHFGSRRLGFRHRYVHSVDSWETGWPDHFEEIIAQNLAQPIFGHNL
jgi:hypothetical protein